MNKKILLIAVVIVVMAVLGVSLWLLVPRGGGSRYVFSTGKQHLVVEFLDEDLAHFEYSLGSRPRAGQPIPTSLMVLKQDYSGPQQVERLGREGLETAEMRVTIDRENLCLTVEDITKTPALTLSTFCPYNFEQEFHGFTYTAESFTQVYGLGEKFLNAGSTDGDWTGVSRYPGEFGNVQEAWNNGSVGNDQFPVAYMAGQGKDSYALFVDNPYKQLWDFTHDPWKAVTYGEQVRFYVLSGPDLPDLRQDFMELVGHAPVPPKKAFGLWVSEYGYDNWAELEDKLATLRANHFPVDGFVLDLQWYGGILEGSDDTRQGSLSWDLDSFPDPVGEIDRLKEQGVGLIVIEQPYVGRNLPEHSDLASKGYLVKQSEDGDPVYLTENPWWGKGGMIDWTNPEASAYWHDTKREPLIEAGVLGHWTDLGEPELYDPDGWYAGVSNGSELLHTQTDVHNLYNLLWSQSIYEGYQRNGHTQRPFILSRSGTAGSQRYGVAMWSGDISSLLSSLATHLNVQMNMSFSGVDYYGSDIGGFWRQGGNEYEMYTQWFASSAAIDTPVRAHTFNLCNCQETAPDRMGDLRSNLDNIRQRYALSPYYYSLAHRAYLHGEPLAAPLVYYYQEDPQVRELGSEKMIGADLLVAAVAESGRFETQVYLPAGTWVEYHTGEWVQSQGEWIGPVNLYPDGYFVLPVYARAGAIIPEMYVDEQTMNILGKRLDGSRRDELIVRVYASEEASQFRLYEDDGESTAYQIGEVRSTLLTQQRDGERVTVTVAAAEGTYSGALETRDNVIRLFVGGRGAQNVLLNGEALFRYEDEAEFESAESGWINLGEGQVMVKAGGQPVSMEKQFVFDLAAYEPALESAGSPGEPLPAYWPTEGWQASTPEQQGMDSAQLARAVDYLRSQPVDVHQMLVIRNGYVVTDAEFARVTSGLPYDRRSMTNVILGALVGIAIEQGYMDSVDQPVLDFFPNREVASLNRAKQSMTVEHLLTMTSGFACNDDAGENSTAYLMMQSPDWVQFALDLPVSSQPGTVYTSCASAGHLLAAVLQKSTGMTALEFARQYLFTALGIENIEWAADPQGVNVGSFGLSMDLEDTARIGLLYLKEGQWDGQQVLPADWVQQSTSPISPELPFGYGWSVDPAGYYDWGYHQHGMFVIPQADLVVGLSGGFTPLDGMTAEILMRSLIAPALQSPDPLPEDEAAFATLTGSMDAASEGLQPQPVPVLPEVAERINGKTYQLEMGEGNTLGLEFPGGSEAYLVQFINGELVRLPIGLDSIYRVFLPPVDYADLLTGDALALKGNWVHGDEFVIDFFYIQSKTKGQVVIAFEGDRMSIEIKVGTNVVDSDTGTLVEE